MASIIIFFIIMWNRMEYQQLFGEQSLVQKVYGLIKRWQLCQSKIVIAQLQMMLYTLKHAV